MADTKYNLSYIEQKSFLHSLNPLIKALWLLIVAFSLFFFRHSYSGCAMLVMVLFLAIVVGKVPLKTVAKSSVLAFGFGLLLAMFHIFGDQGNTVFQFGFLKATDTGLFEGPRFFFRLSVVVLASLVFIWTTNPRDLMISLTSIGVPDQFAFGAFITMRFLPLIQEEIDAVQAAHTVRGKTSQSMLKHRIRLFQRYLFTIVINSLRKAETTSVAVESRGFGAYPNRTYAKESNFTKFGWLFIIGFCLFIAVLFYLEAYL
jgi:energy-coupling factor transport system permease protein